MFYYASELYSMLLFKVWFMEFNLVDLYVYVCVYVLCCLTASVQLQMNSRMFYNHKKYCLPPNYNKLRAYAYYNTFNIAKHRM